MKKQFFLFGAAAIFAFGSCNNSSDSKNGGGDSTSTTTTKTATRIANFETRSFLNLKTGQPVKLMFDTVNHYYVDFATHQQPSFLYYDPAAHDTFDYLGRRLNNALISDNGDYTIDESRVMAVDNSVSPQPVASDTSMNTVGVDSSTTTTTKSTTTTSGKNKMKQKEDKTKTKSKDK